MRLQDSADLEPGIYRIRWKDGRTSLAAVGRTKNSYSWCAPIDWCGSDGTEFLWDQVEAVTRILLMEGTPDA